MFVPATEQQPQVQPQAAPEVTLPEMHSSQILFSPEPVAENPAGSQVLSELPSPSNQPATNVAAPASSMPQPTAPFSSPAPASLGERVIEPLTNPASPFQANDIASQIAQELDAHNNSQTPPASPDTDKLKVLPTHTVVPPEKLPTVGPPKTVTATSVESLLPIASTTNI
jgi:hypothetical protein